MAKTNRDRVGEGLELLIQGLLPFVEREMAAVQGKSWKDDAETWLSSSGGSSGKKINWNDPQTVLTAIWDQWQLVFRKTLGHAERSLVSELRDVRNKWAHMEHFSSDDTYRALDSIGRLLSAVSASEAGEIEKQKTELLRLRFEEQRRSEARKAAVAPVEGQPAGNLRPWRDVVTPHPDVASGRYQQAEFAADLWQVYLREGSDEYRDPTEFFRRTFLTDGLNQLLTNAIRRLGNEGGDPVVELQTNFGGGKTHCMLALYHLLSGVSPHDLPGMEDLLKNVGIPVPKEVHRAVFVGTKISPGKPHRKPDGTVVHTLWGEIAWQLGGKDGYDLIRDADVTATNPGDELRELFNYFSPCLVLIDEWVAYARQLHDEPGLPAGTFDTQFTFAQALTEAAKAAKNTLLVVSIPASESPIHNAPLGKISDIEVGGERGHKALARLKNVIGRVEASWRPASSDEGFEIVRRRLFQPITDQSLFVARDMVARSFSEMYRSQQQEFPSESREADYERRIKAAYPVHPELFDRLYNDWSTLEKFQRTRGVLRLMASVINSLWERQDNSLLIMPANVPIDDPRVQFELTRYMEDHWAPVIEKDVDGQRSLPLELDRENPGLGRYSTCRRVARTIYMGSAPLQKAANRGIDDRMVKLGCVQPGEIVATFGDALRRLSDRATYLYVSDRRYWYSTQPTVNRLADDRAHQLHEEDVLEEIRQRLRGQARNAGNFSRVHVCASSGDIMDEQEARLVILGPDYPNTSQDIHSPARREALAILESRGPQPRSYRNTLVFLAPDGNRLLDLLEATKLYLAWKSIWDERETLNLDPFQSNQAETKLNIAGSTVEVRIPETYAWLLVPGQPDPKGSVEWREIRQQGQDPLAVRASKKLKNEELLMIQLGGVRLAHELNKIPLWRGDHVGMKQLALDFASYLYLPRLRDENVLVSAVKDGLSLLTWESETFAYADAWDDKAQKYKGLVAGRIWNGAVDSHSVLVRPEAARRQMDVAARESSAGGNIHDKGGSSTTNGPAGFIPTPTQASVKPSAPVLRRFHGSVKLDPLRMGRDAGKIAEEVVQHLKGLVNSNVEVTLEIKAEIPDGASDTTVRNVMENCRALRFDSHDFEED